LTLRRQHLDLTKLGDDLLGLMPFPAHLKSTSRLQKPYFTEDHFSGGRPISPVGRGKASHAKYPTVTQRERR
jgi:hypothetical protein